MFASVEYQHRAARSPHIPADVFERASLSILRRYQRAATAADFGGPDGSPGNSPSPARQPAPEPTRAS